jgi:mannose-1-phosphate guanylyltransferase/phosphomannomutase
VAVRGKALLEPGDRQHGHTGIYVMTARAMARCRSIPATTSARSSSQLLAADEPMYGYIAEGYWRDMGDCRAYTGQRGGRAVGQSGWIWRCLRSRPESVGLAHAPGRHSRAALLDRGARRHRAWLPHLAVHRDRRRLQRGRGSLVQRSVLQQAKVGERATVYGAILCANASVRRGAVLGEGTVLGEGERAEENSVLAEGVKLWPGRHAPRGCRLTVSLTGRAAASPRFRRRRGTQGSRQ